MLDNPEGEEFLGVYGGADNESDNLYLIDEKNEKSFNLTQGLPKGSIYVKEVSPSNNTVLISPDKLFTLNSIKCNNLSDIVGEKVADAIYFMKFGEIWILSSLNP